MPLPKNETHMKSTQITVQRHQVTFDGVAKRTRICQAEMRKKTTVEHETAGRIYYLVFPKLVLAIPDFF